MDEKERILSLLRASDRNFLSAAAIAVLTGIPKQTVIDTIKKLLDEGEEIEYSLNHGYRLEETVLFEEEINSFLNTVRNNGSIWDVYVFDTARSTNDMAKNAMRKGSPDGIVIVADEQTAGRGKYGRSFISPKGKGLYMSILLHCDYSMETARLVTPCAACAVAEAIEELCRGEVAVKWVNDLYMGGRKICGILTEGNVDNKTGRINRLIIGIGINVYKSEELENSELNNIVTSIDDVTGKKVNRNRLCAEILNRLDEKLVNMADGRFLDNYRRREMLTGKNITVRSGNEEYCGKAVGIAGNGSLILKLEDGTIKVIDSGDAAITT